ncbi:hypothetical protein D9M70_541250 [compost metagenome]
MPMGVDEIEVDRCRSRIECIDVTDIETFTDGAKERFGGFAAAHGGGTEDALGADAAIGSHLREPFRIDITDLVQRPVEVALPGQRPTGACVPQKVKAKGLGGAVLHRAVSGGCLSLVAAGSNGVVRAQLARRPADLHLFPREPQRSSCRLLFSGDRQAAALCRGRDQAIQ